jgi:hypothetical protein
METISLLPVWAFGLGIFVIFCITAGLLFSILFVSPRQLLIFYIMLVGIATLSAFCGMECGEKDWGILVGLIIGLGISFITAFLALRKKDEELSSGNVAGVVFVGVLVGMVAGSLGSFRELVYPIQNEFVFVLLFFVAKVAAIIAVEIGIVVVQSLRHKE